MEKNQNKNSNYIEKLIADIEDPIVAETHSYNYLGYFESLILNSIYSESYQKHLLDKLDTMRKSEMDSLVIELKENQRINDPKNQFKQMAKAGVFTSFSDQN